MNKIEFYRETEFQETPIGKIPKEWKVVKLIEVAEIRKNKMIDDADKVAFIPMEAIPEDGRYAKFEIRDFSKVKSYVYCERGDILLAKVTPCFENGKQAIIPDNIPTKYVLATTEVYPIIARNIHREFLFYILKHKKFRQTLEARMKGTTGRRRVPRDALESLLIPAPPFSEQKAIAQLFSIIDSATEKIRLLIDRAERLKKGLMQELLTKGIGHKEYKETPIGKIPKEWQTRRLGDLITFVKGKKPKEMVEDFQEGCLPYLSTEYLREGKATSFVKPSNDVVLVNDGDLILLWDGSNAGEFFYGKRGVLSSTMVKIELQGKEFDQKFLFYTLKMKEDFLKKQTRGTGIPHVDEEVLSNLIIPVPPIEEQRAIIEVLSTVDRMLELGRREWAKLENIKRGLMDLLLTGRVRVKAS